MTAEATPNLGLEDANRKEIADGLSHMLADTFTLYVRTLGYHWNVTGPHFPGLHALFEEQYIQLREAADELAERIRAIGEPSPGSYAEFVELTSVEDAKGTPQAKDMVKNLADGHETIVRVSRPLVEIAEKAGDVATADLVTERIREHEKTAWMLRSTAA